MGNNKVWIGKISLVFLSVLASFHICYFLAEHFFFDKFFYRKSISHGYAPDIASNLSRYGNRARDIVWLQNKMRGSSENVGLPDDDTYTIAVIGDSVTWGQGIKNDERFSVLLEKKLNKIRKTKVYSYALLGDNFTQTYEKIEFLESLENTHKIDLYILALVHNDAFVTPSDRYLPSLSKPIIDNCAKFGLYTETTPTRPTAGHEFYKKITLEALDNPANVCIINKIIENLPQNLIVLEADNNFKNDILHEVYNSMFDKFNIKLLSPLPYYDK